MENLNELTQFGKDFKERVENALICLKNGRGVMVVDDENRENEGDLIFPAESMTVADMALMVRTCTGIVCLCLKPEKADELELFPMVQENSSKYQTPFTVTIEAREGVTTGVSAADRIQTIRTAVADEAKPEHLARPGHVFPLRANPAGVLGRRGHTEGSIDLMVLAGLKPVAVLCELTNDDGSMAKLPEISAFAREHQTTVVSIEDIVQYRLSTNS
ncbi:3,4-dihydroxy-2-butanone-4-phosphate synthase [Pedobacter sp. AW31-3R]|uniref:3,4-dihydroxy-2-butanone-4-phosphate synthase n=1 Tax=Pedobacter sp. AW31-3R TaxID=3445781 RepID=UPI003F9F1E6E